MYAKRSDIARKAKEVGERVGAYVEDTADTMGRKIENFTGLTNEYYKLLENYSYKHPFRIIGISLCLGAGLTLMVRSLLGHSEKRTYR